jgi:hypothetical protein
MTQENYISLYDYLGKAAGAELGKQVNEYAKKINAPFKTREISNPKYKGKVLLYTKELLEEFFKLEKHD